MFHSICHFTQCKVPTSTKAQTKINTTVGGEDTKYAVSLEIVEFLFF